jgi:hypothetical protein
MANKLYYKHIKEEKYKFGPFVTSYDVMITYNYDTNGRWTGSTFWTVPFIQYGSGSASEIVSKCFMFLFVREIVLNGRKVNFSYLRECKFSVLSD